MYHLQSNVICVTVGLVYINLQATARIFLARLVSDNSGSLEKLESPLRKKILHGVQVLGVLVRGYLRVRFDLFSSIYFRDISGFPKSGAHNPCTFSEIAFDMSNVANRNIRLPLCVLPP